LHFNIQYSLDQWWADNGSASFCLTQSDINSDNLLHIQSSSFEQDCQTLLERGDVKPLSEIQSSHHILTRLFQSDCGLKLLIFHESNEDERDELVPLPMSLHWDEQVMLQTQRILRVTPIPFRDKARTDVTEKAELKAVSEGTLSVNETNAMQALVEVTPAFQHRALFDAMLDEGIQAELYLNSQDWAEETGDNDI